MRQTTISRTWPEHRCRRGRNPTLRAGRGGRGKSAKQRQGRTGGDPVYLYTPIHSRLVARPLRWRRRGHQLIKGGVIAQCVAAQRIILGHAAGLDFAPCHISQPAPVQRAIDKAYLLPTTTTINASVWSDRLQNCNPLDYFQPEQAFTQAWVNE